MISCYRTCYITCDIACYVTHMLHYMLYMMLFYMICNMAWHLPPLNADDVPPLNADDESMFSSSECIIQDHVRKYKTKAAELKDLIQEVLHHPDVDEREVQVIPTCTSTLVSRSSGSY
jgi:hypothetical protein